MASGYHELVVRVHCNKMAIVFVSTAVCAHCCTAHCGFVAEPLWVAFKFIHLLFGAPCVFQSMPVLSALCPSPFSGLPTYCDYILTCSCMLLAVRMVLMSPHSPDTYNLYLTKATEDLMMARLVCRCTARTLVLWDFSIEVNGKVFMSCLQSLWS